MKTELSKDARKISDKLYALFEEISELQGSKYRRANKQFAKALEGLSNGIHALEVPEEIAIRKAEQKSKVKA